MTDLTLFRIPFFEENSFFETKKEICIFSFFLSSVGREKSSWFILTLSKDSLSPSVCPWVRVGISDLWCWSINLRYHNFTKHEFSIFYFLVLLKKGKKRVCDKKVKAHLSDFFVPKIVLRYFPNRWKSTKDGIEIHEFR